MRVGTRSILFGAHQFVIHPFFVFRAWCILYRRLPKLHEFWAIVTHDLGYWGSPNMDGVEGERHPEVMANWWLERANFTSRFRVAVADEILGHSRFFAAKYGIALSRLFRADKLAVALYPRWLYLLLANLSGEIHEYIRHSRKGNHSVQIENATTQIEWVIEIQAQMALMGLLGEKYKPVKELFEKKK